MRLGPGLPEIDLYDVRHSHATAGREAKISSCHLTCEPPWLLPIADRVAAAWLSQIERAGTCMRDLAEPGALPDDVLDRLHVVRRNVRADSVAQVEDERSVFFPGLTGSRLAQ